MLRVGGIRSAPKGQQPPSAQKTLGHLAARLRQAWRFTREELLEQMIALEQPLFNLTGEFTGGWHRFGISAWHLANSRQWIADQHIYNPAAAVTGGHQHGAGRLFTNFSDDLSFASAQSEA